MPPRDRRLALVVAAVLFAVLVPGLFLGLPPSRGKAVAGAVRVLAGEVPYRDFWTMYAPGQFYAVAGLFALFGKELIAQGVVAIALRAAAGGVLTALALRLGAGRLAAAAFGLLVGVSTFELAPELGSYPVPLLCMLLALQQMARYWLGDEGSAGARLVRAGLALGVAAWFKHDVGAYLAVGIGAGLVFAELFVRADRPSGWLPLGPALARFGAGALAPVVPAVALLAVFAGADAWQDLVAFPAGDFRIVRAEGYPSLLPTLEPLAEWLRDPGDLRVARDTADHYQHWLLCNGPQWTFACMLVLLAVYRERLGPGRFVFGATCLLAMPLYWLAAHVQKNTHLTSLAVLSLLAIANVLGAWPAQGRALRALLFTLAASFAAGLVFRPIKEAYLPLFVWGERVALGVPGTTGVHLSGREARAYRRIVDRVRADTLPGEPIHVGIARHDAVVVSNPRFYHLCDRPAATRYQELHPGITGRADVQREMIADIEAARVRCIVLWRLGWPEEAKDRIAERRREQIPGAGATILDDHIRAEFERVLESDEYELWWRKGAPRGGPR